MPIREQRRHTLECAHFLVFNVGWSAAAAHVEEPHSLKQHNISGELRLKSVMSDWRYAFFSFWLGGRRVQIWSAVAFSKKTTIQRGRSFLPNIQTRQKLREVSQNRNTDGVRKGTNKLRSVCRAFFTALRRSSNVSCPTLKLWILSSFSLRDRLSAMFYSKKFPRNSLRRRCCCGRHISSNNRIGVKLVLEVLNLQAMKIRRDNDRDLKIQQRRGIVAKSLRFPLFAR